MEPALTESLFTFWPPGPELRTNCTVTSARSARRDSPCGSALALAAKTRHAVRGVGEAGGAHARDVRRGGERVASIHPVGVAFAFSSVDKTLATLAKKLGPSLMSQRNTDFDASFGMTPAPTLTAMASFAART